MEATFRSFRYEPDDTRITPRYSASLYLDGKHRGTVAADGTGAPNRFSEWAAEHELNAWGAEQRPPTSAQQIINRLVYEHVLDAERRGASKKLMRRLRRDAKSGQLIVVGLKLDAQRLTAVGALAGREVLAATMMLLARRDGATAFEVFNCQGARLESSGELGRPS